MTDERATTATVPPDLTPEQMAAAGLRPMTKHESMAACAMRDNFSDPRTADRAADGSLPLYRQRLTSALATLEGLTYELKTRRRRLVSSEGMQYEIESPFFVDAAGRDEPYWRAQAVESTAEIAKLGKAGVPTDEAALHHVADLRLNAASALNVADEIAFNYILLKRSIAEARQMVQIRTDELEELMRRTRDFQ